MDETKRSEVSEGSVVSSVHEEESGSQAEEKIEFATSQMREIDDNACFDVCNPKFARRLLQRFGIPKERFIGNMLILSRNAQGIPIMMAGPFWTMLVFITIPLCIIGPALICIFWCSRLHLAVQILYGLLVLLVSGALLSTALRNPGILRRYHKKPSSSNLSDHESSSWVWNDQTRTFKPQGARFDPWCNCVILEFDHTCPWTGTAIGKNNIRSFRLFVTSLQFLAYATAAVFILAAVGAATRKNGSTTAAMPPRQLSSLRAHSFTR